MTNDPGFTIFTYMKLNKEDYIAKYGEDKYKEILEYSREYNRKRQHYRHCNDPEWKARRNAKNKLWKQSRYIQDKRIDLVENYDLAKADNFKDWDLHHRNEIITLEDGNIRTMLYKDLIEKGLYYNRPPEELIWLRHGEHSKLHMHARIYGSRI